MKSHQNQKIESKFRITEGVVSSRIAKPTKIKSSLIKLKLNSTPLKNCWFRRLTAIKQQLPFRKKLELLLIEIK